MKEQGKRGGDWKRRLIERYRQPSSNEVIVLRGQRSATVYGCQRILLYSPERICLRAGKKKAVIVGKNLVCASFTGGAVTVIGSIFGVAFEKLNLKEEGKDPRV